MCLLDDVRLIESEHFALPIVSTLQRSINWARGQQVMNSSISEALVCKSRNWLEAIAGKKKTVEK